MNSTFERLAKQAGAHWNHGDFNMGASVEFQESDLEKFAMLIVQQCIHYLDGEINRLCEYQKSLPDRDENKRDNVDLVIEKCMDNIAGLKEHFGI
jgi:hypothetical protein